ncbi:MAG: type II toxin-antitoxin system RelE/ParE family toxin [Eggerthellaceae bacterium]|nr:type II toxin-antitoxin system RelE/ParE family toxin [Eggerthellaceae bacterium]
MGYSLVVAPEFEDDLDAIVDYHVNQLHAPKAAKTLLDELDMAIELVQQIPTINAVSQKPLLRELGYREQQVRKYVFLYRFDSETVFVMRMFHLTQDFECRIEE